MIYKLTATFNKEGRAKTELRSLKETRSFIIEAASITSAIEVFTRLPLKPRDIIKSVTLIPDCEIFNYDSIVKRSVEKSANDTKTNIGKNWQYSPVTTKLGSSINKSEIEEERSSNSASVQKEQQRRLQAEKDYHYSKGQ